MAAYYDPYDSRPRPSRRNDSFTRSNDESCNSPAAGHASTSHERVGEMSDKYHNYRGHRHSYDPRYHYPPPPPPDGGRPGPPRRPPPAQRRHSWPPPVTCEDEATSLAKEAGTARLLKEVGKDEAGSRGTVDQEPIIQEVPELINQLERRFVIASDEEREAKSSGNPTPPTSEDERARKLRRKPSRLNTDLDDGVPEMSRRTASPYAFSKPTKLRNDISSNERYLSPTTLTPPPTDSARRRHRTSTSSKVSSPRRDSVRGSPSARRGTDYFSAGYGSSDNAIIDDDWDTSDSASHDSRRNPRPTTVKSDKPESSPQTSVMDFAPPPPKAQPIRMRHLDTRRHTDTANSLPTTNSLRAERPRRVSPLIAGGLGVLATDLSTSAVYSAPNTPGSANLVPPRSREGSYASSRGVSPVSTASNSERAPPRSPRQSADVPNAKKTASPSVSANASASPSRPSSPSPRTSAEMPRLPRTDLDWKTVIEANAARRKQHPLSQATRQESVSEVPRASFNAGPSRPATSLPYPLDDGPGTPSTYMPSENQYFAQPRSYLPVPSAPGAKSQSRPASPAPSNASRTSTSSRSGRPNLGRVQSAAPTVSPTEERPRPKETRNNSFTNSPQTKKELAALLKRGLPDCRRAEPVAGYEDCTYTVIGAPGLTFCPDCVESVFERTIYRPSIRLLPQLDYNEKVKCSFGSSPWMRLAWLLTLQQGRTDLTLLMDLADIEQTSEPCPGSLEAVRSWYGLRDHEGYFVRDFHICYSDVRKIERLLPTLSGFFVRLPHRASYGKFICAVRGGGNRFPAYLDALISTHEKALASRRGPDTMPFIELVERKTSIPECKRDNMLMGGLWHFIPSIPSLTVCEDCYETIVEPEVKKDSDVAMRFNRTVQPVYGEGMGSSCQLYSRRMRKVFQRAIEDKDLKYLARKSKERREAELKLQDRYKDVLRRFKRMSQEGSGSEMDERRLNRELENITEEWKAKWE